MKRRLLFVDDDPNLLMGLKRGLHSMRDEWEMEFAQTGESALEMLSRQSFDVAVSDMRMPGMTGLELLNTIQERYPQTIRILLSGQSDRQSILDSVARAHQYLSKPCDIQQLKELISQTMALSDLLENAAIKSFISRLNSIPSLPSLYLEVTEALRATDPSPARIGDIIARDMGMTAKILQVANSAIYGIRVDVTQPEQAVLLLGLDSVQSLVLSLSIFSAFGPALQTVFSPDALWDHSSVSGAFCRIIARAERIEPAKAGGYLSAGLLHDIGKLVIASADPERYRAIVGQVAASGKPTTEIEQDLLGCSHAEIGAYLLGLWGLPVPIVEAVAWHHRPSESSVTQFSPLAAVHVASALLARSKSGSSDDTSVIDTEFLQRIGRLERLEDWTERCEETLLQGQAR
jgi:HD-like signal output (HDOD) protein